MSILILVYLIGAGIRTILCHGLFSSSKAPAGLNVDIQLFANLFWPFFMLWNVWEEFRKAWRG